MKKIDVAKKMKKGSRKDIVEGDYSKHFALHDKFTEKDEKKEKGERKAKGKDSFEN